MCLALFFMPFFIWIKAEKGTIFFKVRCNMSRSHYDVNAKIAEDYFRERYRGTSKRHITHGLTEKNRSEMSLKQLYVLYVILLLIKK